ncbi:MAG: hypothetical protein Q9173_004663 [Seirophora scorigena]
MTPTLASTLLLLVLVLLLFTPNLTNATPAVLQPRAGHELTDPYKYQVPNSAIYLLLSGFRSAPRRFDPSQLLDLAQMAQTEVAGEVLPRGDVPIHTPNQEWCSWHGPQPVCLRVNWPDIDKVVT